MKTLIELMLAANTSYCCDEDNTQQMKDFMLLIMEECATLAENTYVPYARDDGESLAAEHIRLTARAIRAHG